MGEITAGFQAKKDTTWIRALGKYSGQQPGPNGLLL